MDLSGVSDNRLRQVFKKFNRFMLLIWRLGLGAWGNGTQYGGYVMVIKHKGRRTGNTRHTPVNDTLIENESCCLAALGEGAERHPA